jgi:hypothetical protein
MNYRNILQGVLIVLSAAGCTCRQDIRAYVKDAETREPVMNATVTTMAALDGKYRQGTVRTTDSNGRFLAGYDVGGVAKCPVMKLFIEKEGYERKLVVSPNAGDTIFINKIQ